MNKYSNFTQISDSIDLHNLNGAGQSVIETDVWTVLDAFMQQMYRKHSSKLKKGFGVRVGMVVGKGTRTKNWIKGKNPLRAYTESYLSHCGLSWRNGRFGEGEEGVVVVELG